MKAIRCVALAMAVLGTIPKAGAQGQDNPQF